MHERGEYVAADDDHGTRLAKIVKTGLVVFGGMWLLSGITYNPGPEDIARLESAPRKHWSQR